MMSLDVDSWFESKTLNRIKNWFVHSETILWARLQVAAGIIWAVLSVTDMAPLLTPKWLAIWGIVTGIIGEYLRRRGTQTMTSMVRMVPGEAAQPVRMLSDNPLPGE